MSQLSSIILVLALYTSSTCADRTGFSPSPLVVCPSDGCVRGKAEAGNLKPYSAWYGVPYAAAPVGPLRFKNPVPPLPWRNIVDATSPREVCVQSDFLTKAVTGSEDCLHLNVYAPKGISTQHPLPVLVFIHGGSFKAGSADPGYFGPDYLMDTGEVVVVTMQYRLGVFGFLASGDRHCQGNFGIKDQHLALKWVHENIRKFGGDPKRVTVMGQSAGAASVQYHMVNAKANGLFHKVILSSGSAFASWASVTNPLEIFRRYAAVAQIPLANSLSTKEIVKILKTKSAEDLMKYHDAVHVIHPIMSVVGPVIEGDWPGAYIGEDPEYVWESCDYEQRPILTSINGYEEGAYSDLIYNPNYREQLLASPAYILSEATEIPEAALQPIFDYYFGGTLTAENLPRALKFIADSTMLYPGYKTVKQFTQCGNIMDSPVDPVFFNFTSSFSLAALTNPYPIEGRGASHTDDLLYVFRFKNLDPVFKRKVAENQMKDYMIKLIVNYMKKGVKYTRKGLKRCTIEHMEGGFCYYRNIQRIDNRLQVTVSNQADMGAINAIEQADRIADQLPMKLK